MVKIAIAGGSSGVGQEIVEDLVAAKKHEILLLTRKFPDGTEPAQDGVTWVHADYGDVSQLASLLQGVHTVLSFVIPSINTTGKSDEQKNLVDAAIRAGVKRFAPSEWPMREYLEEVNKDARVLEYCLFQPGFFTNYLVHPRRTTKHLQTLELNLDFPNRRAIVAEGSENSHITLTTVRDLAAVMALAVEYPGEWPVVGGIRGEHMTKLAWNDLEAGILKSSWRPEPDHPAVPKNMTEAEKDFVPARFAMNIKAEVLASSDEWNRLLPDYKFTKVEEFIRGIVGQK
ncbi:hypothetical protein MCOR01_002266 [Pyricularia oryzae]|nr:hypothetical protein MCOR01_002266 [Pyricularia oryzae]